MLNRCRYVVLSLVLVFSTLFLLFSNTLRVNAASVPSGGFVRSFSVPLVVSDAVDKISNSSIYLHGANSSYAYGSFNEVGDVYLTSFVNIDDFLWLRPNLNELSFDDGLSASSLINDEYYMCYLYVGGDTLSSSSNFVSEDTYYERVDLFGVYDASGNYLGPADGSTPVPFICTGYTLRYTSALPFFGIKYSYIAVDNESGSSTNRFATINLPFKFRIQRVANPVEVSNRVLVSGGWSGSSAVSSIASQTVNIAQTQEEMQATQEEMKEEQHGFFSSFFDNLFHIFVPEDDFFTEWFEKVNELLSSKLGFLYFPFDFIFTLLNAIYSADGSSVGFTFPEISWDSQVIIPETVVSLDNIGGQSFSELRDAIYFGTDVILLFAFINLLRLKLNLIMRGSEE